MATKEKVNNSVMIFLHNTIEEKFEKEFGNIKTDTQKYGYDNFKEDEPNLKFAFFRSDLEQVGKGAAPKDLTEAVVLELFGRKFSGRKLKQYLKEAEDKKTPYVAVDKEYLDVFLKYINCDSLESLIEKNKYNISPEDYVFYHGYYFDGDDMVKVELIINRKTKEVTSYSASTKTHFKGDIEYVDSHSVIQLKSLTLEKLEDKEFNYRIVKMILCKGNNTINNRQLKIGTFSSIAPNNYPFSCLIIFKNVLNPDDELSSDEKKVYKEFLYNQKISFKETHISRFEDLSEHLHQTNPRWEKNQQILKNMAGDFAFYSNNSSDSCFNKAVIHISENGSFIYKDSNSDKNRGKIKVLNNMNVVMIHETYEGLQSYYTYLKLYNRTVDKMTGVFVGINNKNEIVNDGIYFKRLEADESFDDLSFTKVPYNDQEFLKLKTEDNNFEKYLFSDCEDSQLLVAPSRRMDLSEYEGYYNLYYSSSRTTKTIIRESYLYINNDGKCSLTYKSLDTLKGRVKIVRDLMYILLRTNDDFFGIITLPLDDRVLRDRTVGTISSITTDRSPVVRKIALTRRQKGDEKILVSKEVKLNSADYDALNKTYDGLADLLSGRIENYIKISNATSFETTINYGKHFYNSACISAQKENYEEAKEAIHLALTHGFNNREELVNQIKNGYFKNIESDIMKLLKLVNLD